MNNNVATSASYQTRSQPQSQSHAPLHEEPADDASDAASDADSHATDPRFRPAANPPAAAPPSPPPTPATTTSWKTQTAASAPSTDYSASYGTVPSGNGTHSQPAGTLSPVAPAAAVAPPTNSFRGDATLRPNIGLTNAYEDSLFGWTLQQLIVNLRTVNLIASALTTLWALVSWLGKFIAFKLRAVVLLVYLLFLSLALFLVDLMGFYRTQLSQRGIPAAVVSSSSSSSSFANPNHRDTHTFVMEERIRDQLGLLYHPAGKAVYLLFLAVLCWSIAGEADAVLKVIGLAYCFSAFGYLYAYNLYPEFRRDAATAGSASQGNNAEGSHWAKQAWASAGVTGRGLAESAARNWSSRWGLGTGPAGTETDETESFLRHHQTNASYTYI